jgi:protein-histidine pros-kinase
MNPEIGQKLDQLSHALTEAMDVKRRVVESLRPALLDHFGLPTALQSYFQDTCAKSGLSCETSVDEELRDLSDDVAIALFRVGQEALTNIIRHARARRVDMRLRLAGDDVELVICDDGVGFDPGSRRFLGTHGISGMRHRVQGLGGTFNVARGPGGGTQVSIRVPRVAPPRPVLYADAAP